MRPHLIRHAPLLLTLGAVSLAERFVTVVWSRTGCLAADGPLPAGLGMPLPYQAFSNVSSGQFNVMPHVYLLNLALLALLVHPLVRRAMAARCFGVPWRRALAGAVGGVLCLLVAAWMLVLVHIQTLWPVASIGDGLPGYAAFRPVGVAWSSQAPLDCTPSPFWFPARP